MSIDTETCHECGDELELSTSVEHDGKPLDCYEFVCPSDGCPVTLTVATLWYPDESYEAVTSAQIGRCGECDAEAEWIIDPNDEPSRRRCGGCVMDLYPTVVRDAMLALDTSGES